jgi:hypothetical protein
MSKKPNPPEQGTVLPLPWTVKATQCLLFPNHGGVQLTLVLDLPEEAAAPFRQAGEGQFQQLHEATRAACLSLAEAIHVRDCVQGLANDQKLLEKARNDLAATEGHLLNGHDLVALGRAREDARNQVTLLTERLTQRRQELPGRLEAFRRAAERRAQSLRIEALALAESQEQSLGGCIQSAGPSLAELIRVGVLLGILRGQQDQYLASELAEKLAPPLPAPASSLPANPFAPPWQRAPTTTGELPVVAPAERRRRPPPDAVRPPPPTIEVGAIPVVLTEREQAAQEQLRLQTIALVAQAQAEAEAFAARAAEVAALQRRANGGKPS